MGSMPMVISKKNDDDLTIKMLYLIVRVRVTIITATPNYLQKT